ncbi:toll/interleukin-1 receptor domain-containing protein [Actinoplanes couchii]|uniref:ADP-ribosyl cyclase/cyclic ADP-ribose hydrolase n=1 Tax=Actinoplanes couchii TaxID=403638 RepID=A0ABQ3X2P1_9ACTN|nr:toll/interleukin-1 receptor domain-containing protein [Actinoplanes couchii]MDR6322522.1 hypothetical protein [Actinoplanes couchii]GID52754.1 hypothetical protein Aco03nite_011580 [Actinoplanes couchii]
MTSEGDLRRYRADANRYRSDISKASGTVATQRKKAADAMTAASKSKSSGTIRMKQAEADRATKAANDAEKKRADLEAKLAATEVKITKAQETIDKNQRIMHEKAMRDLRSKIEQASSQFKPTLMARQGNPFPGPSRQFPNRNGSMPSPTADVFLSHASEDKDEIARPLKDALEARGVSVWFDEIRITVGKSIRREIESGIAGCRFAFVIISPHFFRKQWTQAELDALFGKKMDSGDDSVLPVWHHISKDEVKLHSPLLAGILALNSATMTVEEIAEGLAEAVKS